MAVPSATLAWSQAEWVPAAGTYLIKRRYEIQDPIEWDGGFFVVQQIPGIPPNPDPPINLVDLASVVKLQELPYAEITGSGELFYRVRSVIILREGLAELARVTPEALESLAHAS